jgi:hypothetical protein
MYHLIQTREAFEGRLRTMQGLEFVVAFDPTQPKELGGESGGAWVIRKQTRRKRHGVEDEITVQAAYFVVGENIYMAPSIASVLSSRLVSNQEDRIHFLSKPSDTAFYCHFLDQIPINSLVPTSLLSDIRIHLHACCFQDTSIDPIVSRLSKGY